jgi:hypothetical protein
MALVREMPVAAVAKTIRMSSLIQAAKARARWYRSVRDLIAMAYLLAGKLDFGLPT